MAWLSCKAKFIFLVLFFLGSWQSLVANEAPNVVVTIPPLYDLVLGIMEGRGTPKLLVEANTSPHNFSLTPQHLKLLDQADLIVWIGPDLEGVLEKPLRALNKTTFPIQNLSGLKIYPIREDADWHHSPSDLHDHHHGSFDPHLWLDIDNAIIIVKFIEEKLIALDGEYESLYRTNREKLTTELKNLKIKLTTDLKNVAHKPFFVMHDGYQYFEKAFELNALGALTLDPGMQPSLGRLHRIRVKINDQNARCLFAEPQFSAKIVNQLGQELDVNVKTLDYMGVDVPLSPQGYFEIMQNLAKAVRECLGSKK
ncbi:zinc ABC transporter substrate-binding protein [Candidatus Nucleicultrix amoebiphila]|jgi:zinc transport system substrate-binding protein|uniref:High-affinity zinc uptake system protein ZnuA n=1 Tax=Candidatus Nucleicultrix amoebiphila FS5 TaxID=1414854 RepID=A0A1W6N487_9PROT|nr:zinc ABC transporter substrate-binding protein [Candidatus Nucleicultrix amoebiphila]ARN84578.1 hypothetical protein GQ61_03780 [Candidatus Nucleicultrix amoebiphila FS5]